MTALSILPQCPVGGDLWTVPHDALMVATSPFLPWWPTGGTLWLMPRDAVYRALQATIFECDATSYTKLGTAPLPSN